MPLRLRGRICARILHRISPMARRNHPGRPLLKIHGMPVYSTEDIVGQPIKLAQGEESLNWIISNFCHSALKD